MCCDATYGGLPIKPGIGASGEENCYWIYEYYWGAEVNILLDFRVASVFWPLISLFTLIQTIKQKDLINQLSLQLFCNREDEAIFGRRGSGKDHNCDQNTEAFGIKCCEITV